MRGWAEEFEVRYFEEPSIAKGLRAVADELDDDENLVLIGMWNVEARAVAEGMLQVVLCRLGESDRFVGCREETT